MRKTISIIAAFMLIGNTVFATPAVTNKDIEQNIINISGEATAGDVVSVLIINSGYGIDDVYTNPAKAQQYVRSTYANESGYSFDIKMNVPSDGGGVYTAVVNSGRKSETVEFVFYPIEAKLGIVDDVKDLDTPSELTNVVEGETKSKLDKIIDIYGLGEFALVEDVKKDNLASILISELKGEFDNVNDISNAVKASVIVAALNNASDKAFEDDYLICPEVFGIENTDIYKDYSESVNESGIRKIRASLCGQKFENVENMLMAFKENTVLQLIVNNEKYGSGHVGDILDKYSEILEEAGFKLSRLSKIQKKSKLYEKMATSKAATLEKLADEFNDYEETKSETTGGGGTGSSGGSVGGSNTKVNASSSQVPGFVPSVDTITMFDDIDNVEWAKDAINALSRKGIVSGRGNCKFDPSGNVTRAEFTKMIIGAAGVFDESAECTFADVTDEWAKPYIASALKHGIVNGIDKLNFAPSNKISRQQAAVIVYRTMVMLDKKIEGSSIVFDDNEQIDSYAKEAIDKLSAGKIINGKGNNQFAPKDFLTRAEAAKIIYTALIDNFKTE